MQQEPELCAGLVAVLTQAEAAEASVVSAAKELVSLMVNRCACRHSSCARAHCTTTQPPGARH